MRNCKRVLGAASALLLLTLTSVAAWAQDEVLILETSIEGGVSDAVATQFRRALHDSLSVGAPRPVLSEAATRARLGGDADRLMSCGSDRDCLHEVGEVGHTDIAVVAAVGEAAEIYAYTVDVYDLRTGVGLFFADSDCALCTTDEAVRVLAELGTRAAAAIPAEPSDAEPPPPVDAEPVTLFIRVEPATAEVFMNGEPIGSGVVEASAPPGTHRLTFVAPGYQTAEESIVIAAGDEDKMVNVQLREESPVAVAGDVVRSGGLLDGVDTTLVGSVLTGVGVASLVTGIVLLAIDGETTCSEGAFEECPDVYETSAGGALLSVFGTMALTAGVTLLLWDVLAGEPTSVADESATEVGVGFGPAAGYFTIGGQF